MLCIGICDDSYDARFALRSALERLLEPRRQIARILEFSSGEGLLRWQSHHPGELHLVFLDLEMNQLDGMETARRLRQMEPGMQLAFVTGYDSHVYEGYQVGALGYLLKPPKAAQLADILDRATAILTQTNTAFFLCRSGEITYRIPYAEILYFVSDRRQVTCVTKEKEYTFYRKLDQVAQEVGTAFVRIHQRYLVRIHAVRQFAGNQVFVGDHVLPISRSCQQAAMLALTRASLEGNR